MSNYIEYVAQDRRLMALRILRGIPERRANHFVLRSVLASTGYEELAPTVHNDLLWLAKQGLVLTEELDGGILLGTLTDLGDQVARGLVRVAGVAIPAVG